MNKSFWNGKSVVVTGHTGFKGSWLSLWLSSMGAKVHGYALPPETQPNLFTLLNIQDKIESSTFGDVRDSDGLKKFLKEKKPEIVLHLAAQALVKKGYEDPINTYAINVMGTVCLLDAVRTTPSIKAVVNVTTDKCYENKEWVWAYKETDRLGGYDPYSNSKACSELVTSAFRDSYFNLQDYSVKHNVLVASARAGNVIGGGDWATDRLIPDIMQSFNFKKTIVLRNPSAIRPWQHVLEPLRGYLVLAEKLYQGEKWAAKGWNFAPKSEDAKSVEWIVKYLIKSHDETQEYTIDSANQPHEANLLKLDYSQAKKYLNWEPSLALEQTLDHISSWYRSFQTSKDMNQETMDFIHLYEQLNGIH
jgi:CDP-glucose 4,6-dehydratase